MNTYENYLKEPKSLTVEKMEKLHQEILAEIGTDSEALELYNELIDSATTYATMRAKWTRMSRKMKMDQDSLRTSHHDSVIIHFNMLARYLKMQGKKLSGVMCLAMIKRTDIVEELSAILVVI